LEGHGFFFHTNMISVPFDAKNLCFDKALLNIILTLTMEVVLPRSSYIERERERSTGK
jgi:hypothetical protein